MEIAMLRIWANFNRVDRQGRVTLENVDDMKSAPVELREGMHVVIWDEELEAEGILELEEGKWRARIVEDSPHNKDKSGVRRE